MANLRLTLACWNYDRTRALMDGSVRPEGIDLICRSSQLVGDIMERALKLEFDVSELGFTYYLRSLEMQDSPFIAIPVFPNRFFRHGAIFVNAASRIKTPADLIGKKVGELHRYGHDAGIWAKGALSDDYGVPADSYTYYVGGLDKPSPPRDWAPFAEPENVRIRHLGPAQTLDGMLESGEIDALFSAMVPPSVLRRSPKVGRLFENYEEVERNYFRRTAVFPIMHTVVVRKDVYRQNPWIAPALCKAFQEAKDHATKLYKSAEVYFGAPFMMPWFHSLQEKNRELFGDDPWPYGIEANRTTLSTFLRYHHEQGLTERVWDVDEIFAPETLG